MQIHKEETYGTEVSGHYKAKRSPGRDEEASEKVSSPIWKIFMKRPEESENAG